MSRTARATSVVRDRADWMVPKDEVILEYLRDEGNLTPATLEEMDVTVANYASNRLSKMSEYGLVERLGPGLYRLTDDGRAFLNERLDASTLSAETQ